MGTHPPQINMKTANKEHFIIIDGSSLLYRAFYAIPPLNTKEGVYTNAIYGFIRMFSKLYAELQPTKCAIAFDKSRHTFRTEIFSDYKGTREKTPLELKSQIPLLKEWSEAFGLPFLEVDNYEADDIIGTLSKQAALEKLHTTIVTGDRDALQLLGESTDVALTKKGISELVIYTVDKFKDEYGLAPDKLIDLKALMGDKSDNIPGIFGIGEKTALKLLHQYHSLEGIYDHLEEITAKKLSEKLHSGKEDAFLSYRLATINCAVPLTIKPLECNVEPDINALRDFCHHYELNSLLPKLTPNCQGEPAPQASLDKSYKDCLDTTTLAEFTKTLTQEKSFAYLPNVEGKIPHLQCRGLMCAFPDDNDIFYLPMDCIDEKLTVEMTATPSVTYNAKLSLHCSLPAEENNSDLLLFAYMLNAESGDFSLQAINEHYLGENFALPAEVSATEKLAVTLRYVSFFHLYDQMLPLMREKGLLSLYREVEFPLEKVLVTMEKTGIYINKDKLNSMSTEIAQIIDTLLDDIYALAEQKFNVNSPKQLAQILFEKLQLPVQKKTKTGYSTNAKVLEALLPYHPIIEKLLSYRQWTKLKSTYLDGLLPLIDKETQRIHTTFHQTTTVTGRLSSSDPNLQNIPVRTEAGKKIRSLFEPQIPYSLFLSADYSQIELRILAHLSQDTAFVEAFNLEQDIHSRTASEIFGVPLAAVTAEQRRHAKAINFGLVYGKSDYGLAQELHIPRKAAAAYIENYFLRYRGVKNYLDKIVQEAHEHGYTTTLFGRRRALSNINSKNFNLRTQAERMAMNTPIQGTAADIIKMAMLAVQKKLLQENLRSRLLLQVHDELVLETIPEELPLLKEILTTSMQNIVTLSVPLTIDINVGDNWATAK